MSKIARFANINFTKDQENAASKIEEFLASKNDVFILKGYAGSGKTTLIKAVTEYVMLQSKTCQLMAPTGRAAKVLNSKTTLPTTTIHRGIYCYDKLYEKEITQDDKSYTLTYYYSVADNQAVNDAVIIIDEASMVSDTESQQEFFRFGSGKLLFDLIQYSKIKNKSNFTKIIFVGDPAQLPPVGMNTSPALDKEYVVLSYGLKVMQAEMREVKRVSDDNPIKVNSEIIRKSITANNFVGFNLQSSGSIISNIDFASFISEYKKTKATKIVLSYKNNTALEINEEIREKIYNRKGKIEKGDIIINSSNNYSFDIMNGEFAIVTYVSDELVSRKVSLYKKGGEKSIVNLRWRRVELFFAEDNKSVDGYMLENYLYSKKTNILPEEHQALYVDFKNRNPQLRPKTKEYIDAMFSDTFLNAIKLKYGYAITVHKSQGGEWDNVFVIWDRAAGKKNGTGLQNSDFYRWAYTAITRPQRRLINIDVPRFSIYSKMIFIDVVVQNEIRTFVGNNIAQNDFAYNVMFDEFKASINEFGISGLPLTLQHHFAKLSHIAKGIEAKLISWQRKGEYEIWYQFEKHGNTAGFKFWVNAKSVFKEKFMENPKLSNSKSFSDELSTYLIKLDNYVLVETKNENSLADDTMMNIDIPDYEEKPFLQMLYHNLKAEFTDIRIASIESLNYRERYTLLRNNEKAVVDFEYNAKGEYGRVLPIANLCNSKAMITDIRGIINTFKNIDYVV